MTDFSLTLDEDQLQIQKWVHDFAEDVVRPAAHEWDEREETPWPIIEEAAKIGLYSSDFLTNAIADPTGLTLAGRQRGDVLGRRRHRLAIFGLEPRRSPASSQRHARAGGGVGAAVLSARPTRCSSVRSA